ncbi:aminoacyl-tRNA hydrolase [bacterium (Candidatus Gribaldobacteria) CG23_combo_of_CG06-09_8_20_14_all_37_87_8]|uniref:Peptidyl-tRNA hydrolase n=2 Tax=Candidatus Gribaldobacteria TaxID=2798536 RepID=A0A2G9ZFX9_9BACT|nr:MAG: aminoacyl-tRNA hydrolase [bacterium (Candidatus Gribaldobacteria) CG23_combo_of_CG06-09_8_20_14_all_37_87_8]PIR90742.1 MAG: aminoacyl-tRNA hydrolase [bacterium (Candidatus Gribaldobacteria) CG10_big_fil_rev_8_21_14_0_10_37_21]
MKIIIGLGNPGLKYKKTRHNVGFRVLDAIREENDFPKFKLDKKLKSETAKGILAEKEVLLVKPQTFMNSSGLAIKALFRQLSIINNQLLQLIVVHDDFDLPLGEIKIVENSSSGGHHGVQSIIDTLKTQNFTRVKVGIRPVYQLPTTNCQLTPKAEDFVLKKFSKQEELAIAQTINKAGQALCLAIDNN